MTRKKNRKKKVALSIEPPTAK